MPVGTVTFKPIGVIKTPYNDKYEAPRQPGLQKDPVEGIITLFPGCNYEQALEDVVGFYYIWILSWFNKNNDWTPKVLPPRAGRTKKGVFATRSPHRPNPIGLSLCKLIEVKGRTIRVENPDLLDGTPILDLKPYIPYVEAIPDARSGWLDQVAKNTENKYVVEINVYAAKQSEWLVTNHGVGLLHRAKEVLAHDPMPHPSRRTKRNPDGSFILGMKSWRVQYRVTETKVIITGIQSGYDQATISKAANNLSSLHDQEAHIAFHKQWNNKT